MKWMTSHKCINRIAFNFIDNFNEAEEEEDEEEVKEEEEVEEENILENLEDPFSFPPLESAEEISFEGELFEIINFKLNFIYLLSALIIGQEKEKE